MNKIALNQRQKLYLIMVFVSLILLFYSIWQVKPVHVELEAPLGLASYLTPAYWIGLALIVATSIFAFLDRELKKDAIFVIILIALGLFLMGIAVFVEENGREGSNYYPFSEISNWLPTHHLDIANPVWLLSYYSWPVFHFINASVVVVTGDAFDFNVFAQYWPLFFMLFLTLVTYGIGKRFELSPNRCFLLSFLTLSSWIMMVDYAPRTLGLMLYLLFFMLLLTPRKTTGESIAVILILSALVLTHPIAIWHAFLGLVSLAVYKRELRFVALFIVIFGAWYIYQVSGAIEPGITGWLLTPFKGINRALNPTTSGLPVITARQVARYSMVGLGVLYSGFMIGSLILLLRQRITGQRRKQVIFLFAWMVGAALVVLSGLTESVWRTFIFLLVPMASIIALSFSSRRLVAALVVAMVLSSVLSLGASYASEAAWGQVLTSELRGTQFIANNYKAVPGTTVVYYDGNMQFIYYYDPNTVMTMGFRTTEFHQESLDAIDFSVLDEVHYVIVSEDSTFNSVASWGAAPSADWVQTEGGRRADLIYNNGYFRIYENPLAKWE